MPISIVSNSAAAAAQRNLAKSSAEAQRSISKISSGTRVFEAKEDPGALSVGSGLKKEVSALRAATINAQSGISMMQIADGALAQISEIIGRMEALATQSLSDQLSNKERAFLDVEFQNLKEEMDRIAQGTQFNGSSLLGGVTSVELNTLGANIDSDNGFVGFAFADFVDPSSVFTVSYNAVGSFMTVHNTLTSEYQSISVATPLAGRISEYNFQQLGVTLTLNSDFDDSVNLAHTGPDEEFSVVSASVSSASTYQFQLGSTSAAEDRITVSMPVINSNSLGIGTADVGTYAGAFATKSAIREALDVINSARANLGASMNRMEVAAHNISVSMENSELARSALLDADVAAEITNVTAQQVLMEAGTSMLTRANQTPRILLGLIQGS